MLHMALAAYAQAGERTIEWAKLTAYCPCEKCCSWHWRDGKRYFNRRPSVEKPYKLTASGAYARQGLTLAMPKEYSYGTHVYTKGGNLLGVNEDRGGAIKRKDGYIVIDVYMDSHKKALEHGVKWTFVLISNPTKKD